jgi:hypothetical protein
MSLPRTRDSDEYRKCRAWFRRTVISFAGGSTTIDLIFGLKGIAYRGAAQRRGEQSTQPRCAKLNHKKILITKLRIVSIACCSRGGMSRLRKSNNH